MFRFVMPEHSMPREKRLGHLKTQMEDFLKCEALEEIFSLLHTTRENLKRDYDGRTGKDGRVSEVQVLEPLERLEELRMELYPLLYELGFFHICTPLSEKHDRILVLGGALEICFDRALCAARVKDASTLSVDGLACYRPIHPKERIGDFSYTSQCDTEFGVLTDSLAFAFRLPTGKFRDDFHGDRNLNRISCIREFPDRKDDCAFRIFAAPSSEPEIRRADTGDTLEFYVKSDVLSESDSLLAITSNRYCNRQFLQLAHYILTNDLRFDLDVIGCFSNDKIIKPEEYGPFHYLQELISILDWIRRFGL